jgi:hypothetical protein
MLSIYTLRFIRSDVIRSDVIRSVFICSDVIRSDVIRSVIIRSVGESFLLFSPPNVGRALTALCTCVED